jgi:antitoxin component of RelBE/YafQ-DinJ toxin-antitoxin module
MSIRMTTNERGFVLQVRVSREEKRAAERVARKYRITVAEALRRMVAREERHMGMQGWAGL